MASDDEDDYIVFGSPLLDENETVAGQYRKPKQDPAVTKSLPVWQQVCLQSHSQYHAKHLNSIVELA